VKGETGIFTKHLLCEKEYTPKSAALSLFSNPIPLEKPTHD
jgi:hypothetical protein